MRLLFGTLCLAFLLYGPIQHGLADEINLPEMGASVNTVLSPAEERELGESFLRQLRQNAEVLEDPVIHLYLNALGTRLASNSDEGGRGFTFFTVISPDINAFAVPGGFIGVHSGLILHTQQESELASVMAHEIAHVTQRHIARTVESTSKFSAPMIAAMIAAVVVGIKNPEVGQAALASIQAGSIQMQINFTRAHEKEADRVGMQILANSGFEPASMPAFFERLQAANRYYEGGLPEMLRTHPVTTDRIAESRQRAEQYQTAPRDKRKGILFHLIRARLLVLTSSDQASLLRQLQEALENGKYQEVRAVHYALVLVALELGKVEIAREHLAWLEQNDEDRVLYRSLAARVALLEDQPAKAMEIYRRALKLYPGDPLLSLEYANTLLENGKAEQAVEVLQNLTGYQYPNYYRLLAESLKASGQQAEALLALAEYHYQDGRTEMAIEQLHQAGELENLDFYLNSRIDARLSQLEQEFQAQRKAEERQ